MTSDSSSRASEVPPQTDQYDRCTPTRASTSARASARIRTRCTLTIPSSLFLNVHHIFSFRDDHEADEKSRDKLMPSLHGWEVLVNERADVLPSWPCDGIDSRTSRRTSPRHSVPLLLLSSSQRSCRISESLRPWNRGLKHLSSKNLWKLR